MKKILLIQIFLAFAFTAPELVIGEERVEPGIVFIFEGAIKDHIMPSMMHLDEKLTHVHIEARVNWDTKNIPEGAVPNGFVPYLHMTATVTNQGTGLRTFVDLVPHINLIDNFHYARNISLPGSSKDLYSVKFNIIPPTHIDLALHKDWTNLYGINLFEKEDFMYDNVNFDEIVNATRH